MRILPAFIAAVALVLAGCASRLVPPESQVAPPPLGLQAANGAGVRLTLSDVIRRDGPGSWVREANWDEYRVAIANEGPEGLVIESVELLSALPAAGIHTTSLATLDTQSLDNTRMLRSLGWGFGLPGSVTGVAAVAAGAAAPFGGLVVALVALPVVAVGGTIYVLSRRSRDRADAVEMQKALDRRGLALPTLLAPGETVRTSAFFPLTVAPRQLLVRYRSGTGEHELALDLP